MASQNVAGIVTMLATEALGEFEGVTLDSDGESVSQHDAGDVVFGINQYAVAANEMATIHMLNRPGSFKVATGGSFAAGATLTVLASGQFGTGGSPNVLIALEASGGAGEVVEAVPSSLVI